MGRQHTLAAAVAMALLTAGCVGASADPAPQPSGSTRRNHDLLVQGDLAATAATERIAVGSRKVVARNAPTASAAQDGRLTPRVVDRLLVDQRYPVVWCTSRAVSRGPWAESSATSPMPRT